MKDLKEFLEIMSHGGMMVIWIMAVGLIGYGLGSIGL